MDAYQFKRTGLQYFDKLKQLVNEGIGYGLDFQELLPKIDSIKDAINDGIVRIVLLGSFSDGKTSTIAGLLGRLESTMKIDADESSDELTVYRPLGLKKGFEVVDTPGLFGTKEKELDGKNIKFSKITENYLSEAHIVIYVCDAVTPLKESHAPTIRWVMRDLKKLNSSIFVINKMDEAGIDLTDREDYLRGEDIKRAVLIKRLRETINLTPKEERNLLIACIAADPKGKGLEHWFAKSDDYLRRSHIDTLRRCLDTVVDRSNADELRSSTTAIAIKDTLDRAQKEIVSSSDPLRKALSKIDNSCQELESECAIVKREINDNRNTMARQINEYKAGLYADIRGASIETFGEMLDRALGREGDEITGYVVEREIKHIIGNCTDSNQQTLQMAAVKFEREFNAHSEWMKDALQEGAKYLGNVKISAEQILAIRDWLAKTFNIVHKFKPWGATNLAGKITKTAGRIGGALTVVLEIWNHVKMHKATKKLDRAKKDLLAALDTVFADICRNFADEESYYANFAAAYTSMCEQLKGREAEAEAMRRQLEQLEAYNQRISDFLKINAETVEYEDI